MSLHLSLPAGRMRKTSKRIASCCRCSNGGYDDSISYYVAKHNTTSFNGNEVISTAACCFPANDDSEIEGQYRIVPATLALRVGTVIGMRHMEERTKAS